MATSDTGKEQKSTYGGRLRIEYANDRIIIVDDSDNAILTIDATGINIIGQALVFDDGMGIVGFGATGGGLQLSTTSGATNVNIQILPADGGNLEVYTGDIITIVAGKGLIVRTPDGAHTYRIAVDNSGNVTSTLVT
jgi:hypothetical protein